MRNCSPEKDGTIKSEKEEAEVFTPTFLQRQLVLPARLKVVQRNEELRVFIRRRSEQILPRGPAVHRAVEAAAARKVLRGQQQRTCAGGPNGCSRILFRGGNVRERPMVSHRRV